MSLRSFTRRLPFGMGTVAALGSLALVAVAAVTVFPRSTTQSTPLRHGVLQSYTVAPTEQWVIDDTVLPGLTGDGDIEVADTFGSDWLVSYTAGIRRAYVLVNANTGNLAWRNPVDVGFGACAFEGHGTIGCAVRTRTDGPDNGFYLVDRGSGELTRQSAGSDTKDLVGIGSDFLHVNDTGYQVSRRTTAGDTRWSRTFAAAATPSVTDGVLVVRTTDGNRFILDPKTGEDIVDCSATCDVRTYPTGVVIATSAASTAAISFHPIRGGTVTPAAAPVAQGLAVVPGPSTLPVLTTAGDQLLDAHGSYRVTNPASGDTLWQVNDTELSKVHTRPCGPMVSFAKKDRSRVFFNLASGDRIGALGPPSIEDPDADLDKLVCVGASDEIAVFGNQHQLTAYRPATATRAWTLPINGTAVAINGHIALLQGSTLTLLKP